MRVRVTRGPLEGVDGILIRKKNLFRLILSVDMLAQSVAVEVDSSDVEPCSSNNQEQELRSTFAAPSQFFNASRAIAS